MDRTRLVHVLILFVSFINPSRPVAVEQQGLLGCGVITRPARVFPYSPANYDFSANTPGSCMEACSSAGYAYASVSVGRLCFCGSSTANTSVLTSNTTSCQVNVCTGDASYYCGDIDHELVYTSLGVIDSASVEITGGATASALIINQNYQFLTSYIGAVSYINYQIDFGDGTKTGWFAGVLNTTTTISHVFTKIGQFAISVAARSLSGMQPTVASMTVKVSDVIGSEDVSMTCPNVTATLKTVSCTLITARGSDLTGNFSYNTSGSIHSITNVPDTQYYTFGSGSVTHYPTVDSSANLLTASDIVILPQSTVTVAGRIASVQFYASAAGTIDIYLIRRSCTSPASYCYDSNTCGSCSSPYALQCSAYTYSSVNNLCYNTSVSQRYQSSVYNSGQFIVVAQWSFAAAAAGYYQIVANSTANMINRTAYVGDMLAFKGVNLAKVISDDTTEDYRCTSASGSPFTCTIASLSSNNTKYHYLLQMTVIQPVQIAPLMMYYGVGDYQVHGTIIQHGVTSYSASAILPVLFGIESVEIIGQTTGNINVMLSFMAQLHPINATASIYIWYVDNVNTYNSTSNTFNITFPLIGTYNIRCQVQNLLSTKSNSTNVLAQDIITDFSLHAGNLSNVSVSQPMAVARFQIRMTTGSNYFCRVNFNTNQTASEIYFYAYGYIPGSYITYQYLTEGAYNVFAYCQNSISNVSYSFVHYVQSPILGLQLQQTGVIKNTDFRLNFTIAQGTAPHFRVLISGVEVNFTYYQQYNLIQTVSFAGQASSINYTVEIYAWNYLSSAYSIDTFSIVSPIVNPQIRASITTTSFPGPILFEYTVDSGSNIEIAFSFGDTLEDNVQSCYYFGDYPSQTWKSCANSNHTFAIPGTITILAAFKNAATRIYKYLTVTLTTSVNPLELITDLQFGSYSCIAAYVDNRAIASFLLQAANPTAKPASNAEVIIYPDIINRPTTRQGPFQISFNYFASPAVTSSGLNVLYNSFGNYTALFQVRNSIDSTNVSCVVQVVSILQQVYYSITPSNWNLTSSTPLTASVFIGDSNPGVVQITWNFGDGSTATATRSSTQYNVADSQSHSYTAVGTYNLTITVQGSMNVVKKSFTVIVQNPVVDFSVNFSGPTGSSYQIAYIGLSSTISIGLKDLSSPSASNALVFIDYNDTSSAAVNSVVQATLPYAGSYTYVSPGIYTINITAYNQVSVVTKLLTVSINADFNNYAFSLCYLLPTLTDPLDDTCNLELTGLMYYIPKQSQLVLYVTWSNPSAVPSSFEILFNSGGNTVFNQTLIRSQVKNISQLVGISSGSPLYRLVIDLENTNQLTDGSYVVTVRTRNPSYIAASTANIYILSMVAGLTITDRNILAPANVQKTFIAMYQNFSLLSCLYIKYSDNVIDCYGDSARCSILPTDITPQLTSCTTTQAFVSQNSSTVSFVRAFNKSNLWLYAYAWNELTSVTAQNYFAFPLANDNCNTPSIEIQSYTPIMRWARQIKRSQAFSVNAKTILNCTKSLNNTKHWSISQCDLETQRCQSTVYLRQLVLSTTSAQTSEIFIQSLQLPYGYYLFNYTISMNYQTSFLTSSFTYIQIIPSDIQVNLLKNGTSMVTNGVTQSLLFQPGVYSIDPDSNYFNPENWTFAYYCRIYGSSSYPRSNGQELNIESTIVDPLNPSCFDSPGNTSLFKYGPNNNQSILYIQPRALQSSRSYEFKVILTNIYDLSLTYTGYALVQVQDIDSVLISVECVIKMCSPNVEYQRINPTTQALLTSSCIENCDSARDTSIRWSIYQGFQTDYPNADIKWILYTQMDTYENSLFFGRYSKNFTVTSDFFQAQSSTTLWKFESTYLVETAQGIAIGTGAIRFSMNREPQYGTCSIDKLTGTTITPFTIICSNWVDTDGIQDYAFYVVTKANATRKLIAFSTLTQVQVYLPIGDSNTGYTLELTAEIRDIYGAIATFTFPTIIVTVDNASIASFLELAQLALTQGRDNSELEKLLYAGDQNTVCQVMSSISQTLNSMGSSIQIVAATGGISAQTISVSGLLSSSSPSSTANTSENATVIMNAYVDALNSQAIVRDYAIQFVTNLSLTTIDSVQLQAATLADLTSTTSELTRQSMTLATSKCNDLINALNQMITTVTYEDVQLAVESIAELASNILVGISAPLQNRGIALGLDYDRANMLPPDYETDIETVWSNPNLFADADDFSWETIQKNRNLYYQQESLNSILVDIEQILSKAINALSLHMNIGQVNVISTNALVMRTEKLPLSQLNTIEIQPTNDTLVELPALPYCQILFGNQSCDDDTPITMNTIVLPLATAGLNGRTQAFVNMSRSLSLSLYDSYGNTLSVQNLSSPIRMIISRDPNLVLPSMTYENMSEQIVSQTSNNNNRQFALYYVNVTSESSSLSLSATFELKSDDSTKGFMLIYRFDGIPILNSSMNLTDGYQVLCPADRIQTSSDGLLYSYFLNNILTVNHQYAMFGLRELSPTEFSAYCSINTTSPSSPPITDAVINFTSNYFIRSYISACYYLDQNHYWQTDDITVGGLTSHSQTECFTSHLTTFAGGWVVLPAPINWNYVFANMDFMKNKTIYLTMIIIAILYILIMIYARHKDKKDIEKLGVTPLPDNLLNDKYYYQIIVFTGLRKDSGTTSKVHFIISGDNEETGARTLEDPHRKILQRGGIDSFIMAVPKSLGRLNYMRVWHDNSGVANRASWFLKYIVVRDLQTMEKNHFISQQWFAVEKEDGVIDRLIPVAGEEQKQEFAYLLSKNTYHSMSDGHLWFSVFSRPPSTLFTRTQRCTCCFVLLLMSMLMNIMYYDQRADANAQTAGGISIGPFLITPQQIAIGVIVELICFLPSTILVEMFRRLRPRRRPTSPVREALKRIQNDYQHKQQQATVNDIHPQLTNYIVNPDPILSGPELDRMRQTLASPAPDKKVHFSRTAHSAIQSKKKKKKTLPWWFIFVAYGFSAIFVCISILFIIARGIEFGDTKTQQWLTSSVTGFFASVFLTQPLKVVFLAIFFALIIRRDDDELIEINDNDDLLLGQDEEYLHAIDDGSLLTYRAKTGHIPLTRGEVEYAREKRLNEIKMWEIIRELIAYGSFLWILYVVSYSNRDPNAYYLMQHLRDEFLNLGNETHDFTEIYSLQQYWDWLSVTFVPQMRASKWYNGDMPTNLSGYINDKTTRILGWPTMRQLRVKPDSCNVLPTMANVISSCEAGYSMFSEEEQQFSPGWTYVLNSTTETLGNYSNSIRRAFMYNSSENLDTYSYVGEHATYGAGGYVYEFRGKRSEIMANLSLLRELSWLDMQTRGVIIQMSLYNPNVNLFIFVTILTEFLPTGGIYPTARVEPIALINNYQGFELFKLICAIFYMLFIVYYMIIAIRSIFSERMNYFRDFWSYPDLGIIACSWGGVIVYVWRIREGDRVGDLFRENNGYVYVNLQFASYVNDVLTFLLGFCCFFGTIKFLKLLRFNKRISMLQSTLAYAAKDLISFTIMFSILYFGYLALFYLLFHSKLWACSDPLKTAQMLFEMMLLKFDVSDLYAADIFLGPFCFTLFVVFVVFICMNMFISIISDAFRLVRHDFSLQSNEHQIVNFMTNQFKKWTGIGKVQQVDRLHINPYDGTKVQYLDPVTSFPEKMDELLIALNKIYMDTKRHDTFAFRPLAPELIDSKDKSHKKD